MRPFALALLASTLCAQPFPPSLYNALEWRLIGPFRGGRVLGVTGAPGSNTFYFGSVGGGIWKTTDAGMVWLPVFDSQKIASIGAIEVAPSNPDIVYAGTGEADMRSDISFGDGIYKSTDAGKNWTHIGLRNSRQIGRIIVHPKNPSIVYVAALGHPYGPNPERGVFKTTDGGTTWTHILDKGPDVGAIDLSLDPDNPEHLYAALWNARRPPWSQYPPIDGPGSGLYRSNDGGKTWTELMGHGLPGGKWGRVGIAIAPSSHGRRIYATIDAPPASGLYRSDDSGETWSRVSNDARVSSRAWYFSSVTVDPKNPDVVYLPNVGLYRSTDGGRTFTVVRGAPGGDDYHTLWIDPANPDRMVLGTDQGTTISIDGARTWTTWYNQPTAQFYHVATDNQFPYYVYGCQQDSGTAAVPSRTNHGLISERDWFSVGGAESGYIATDPKDPNIVYVNNTYGSLTRFDKRTSQGQNITPWPAPAFGQEIPQRKYRNTWTSPLVFSAADPTALYFGTQYLLKTIDGGLHWHEISPDLTGDERKSKDEKFDGSPAIDNAVKRGYGVIYTIAPSPLSAAQIWTGSDTGRIFLTRDAGKTWTNVTPPGLSDWSKITQIEASHFAAGEAWAAVDRHRLEDYAPHLYRTRDFGKTWTEVTAGITEPAFFNSVKEDPHRRGLLYGATELGAYVSFDAGDHWQPLQLNLPVTSVRDLEVHGDDLVIATHGRGFWILDDVTPLREIDAKVAATSAYLFQPAKALRVSSEGFQGTPLPVEEPRAKNPPDGAVLDYYFASVPAGEVTLEILDRNQKLVRRYSSLDVAHRPRGGQGIADVWLIPPPVLPAKTGMNRFVWDLRYAGPAAGGGEEGGGGPGGAAQGPFVLPGTYTAKLTAGGASYTRTITVGLDPRSKAAPAELAAQLELAQKIMVSMRQATELRAQSPEKVRPIMTLLSAALNVTNSADRMPPASAYEMQREAEAMLSK